MFVNGHLGRINLSKIKLFIICDVIIKVLSSLNKRLEKRSISVLYLCIELYYLHIVVSAYCFT